MRGKSATGKSDSAFHVAQNPAGGEFPVYLVYDPTHLIKNVRNNWCTEATQTLELQLPSGQQVRGNWSDIVSLHKAESGNVLRQAQISHAACHPTPQQRQKVSLVMEVFNDKTVAMLRLQGKHETADLVLTLWKVWNVKSPATGIHLNDSFRKPITSVSSLGMKVLDEFLESLESMKGGRGVGRCHSLTSDTRQAFCQTLRGLKALASDLLTVRGLSYVLLGQFQQDKLEGEFGVYRQGSGGCYFISVEQLLCSARFRRMELYSRLTKAEEMLDHTLSLCCATTLCDREVELLDYCPEGVDDICKEEHGALYYVCGYITKKEGLPTANPPHTEHSEFTELVSRCRLSHPPDWLFVFGQFCYSFFQSANIHCATRLSSAFTLVFDSFFDVTVEATVLSSITRRMSHCFLAGFVRQETDSLIPNAPSSSRVLRKLNAPS